MARLPKTSWANEGKYATQNPHSEQQTPMHSTSTSNRSPAQQIKATTSPAKASRAETQPRHAKPAGKHASKQYKTKGQHRKTKTWLAIGRISTFGLGGPCDLHVIPCTPPCKHDSHPQGTQATARHLPTCSRRPPSMQRLVSRAFTT